MWYHGTNKAQNIIEEGFNVSSITNGRRFGHGVYFGDSKDSVSGYGNQVISVEVEPLYIISMTIDEVNKIIDRLIIKHGNSYEDYFQGYINKLSYNALQVIYRDNHSELIVYDVNLIKINTHKKTLLINK